MRIKTVFDFNKALSLGPYAWPGGYPYYFITIDDEALSFDAAVENADLIRDAIINNEAFSGWRVVGMVVNWEDNELYCAHSGVLIPSAYADDE